MTLVQMRVFLAAARLGSFTAAAAALHMAQPSVSEFVRRLETAFGMKLFVRGGRRLILTPAGEALVPLAERTVASADQAVRALRAISSLDGGLASFGLLRNSKYYQLEMLLAQFHLQHPGVRLRVVGLNSVEVASSVASGELEAGLAVLPIDAEGLTITPLRRDEVLYASAHESHVAKPVTIEDLAAHKLVLYDAHYGWTDPTRRQIAERAQLAGIHLEAMIEVEQVESALTLVAAGLGDTFVSRAVAESDACPPNLHFTPFAEPLYDTIALVHKENAVLSPATSELIRLARNMIATATPDSKE
jgi:DNA-binding transcriptional LysR family regulator